MIEFKDVTKVCTMTRRSVESSEFNASEWRNCGLIRHVRENQQRLNHQSGVRKN